MIRILVDEFILEKNIEAFCDVFGLAYRRYRAEEDDGVVLTPFSSFTLPLKTDLCPTQSIDTIYVVYDDKHTERVHCTDSIMTRNEFYQCSARRSRPSDPLMEP